MKMTQMSRLEINVRRLIRRCEEMAKEDLTGNWRLEKYIEALDEMINKLQNEPTQPSKDMMMEYVRQVDFLKGLIATSKLSNPIERVVAAQMLPSVIPISLETNGPNIATQIYQKTTAKYNQEMRAELFKTKSGSIEDGVRQRTSNAALEGKDFESLLKYNRNVQEKVAENMLYMANTIKEHALTANAIIKKDIDYLEKSDKLTDSNEVKLKTESLKLEEHKKSNWRCWVWLMVAFVLAVFFNMVLFMKVSKKKV